MLRRHALKQGGDRWFYVNHQKRKFLKGKLSNTDSFLCNNSVEFVVVYDKSVM